jgi:antitoxin component of MazEF toxin-antitoxin module
VPVKIERTLKKVGGSVMVPIPAEILRELRWEPGLRVSVDSEGNGIRIVSAVKRPSPEVMEFVAEFFEEYDEAMRELADR